jgi:hypothetical protein
MDVLDSVKMALEAERHTHKKDNEYLTAEIASLRAALEPFAKHAVQVETLHPGWYHEGFEYSIGLPMKWFIEARGAYEQKMRETK